jgi:hypothetical protein
MAGGATTALATVPGYEYFGVLAPSGAVNVWGTTSDLLSVDADGGVGTVTSALPYDAASIAYDTDGSAFIASGNGVIERFDGASITTVTSIPGLYVGNIAVDADNVYVSGEQYLVPYAVLEAVVGYVPKTGGTFTPLFERTGTYTWMAIDRYYVYMTDRWGADVLRMEKDGAYQDTLVQTGGLEVLDVVVDDECVYWTGGTATMSGVWTASKNRLF